MDNCICSKKYDESYNIFVIDYIDNLVKEMKYDKIYELYNKISFLPKHNKFIRKYINNKNINKSQQKNYYCNICDKTYKYSYKYLHLKSMKHLMKEKE
jgi:hypothetical protein